MQVPELMECTLIDGKPYTKMLVYGEVVENLWIEVLDPTQMIGRVDNFPLNDDLVHFNDVVSFEPLGPDEPNIYTLKAVLVRSE